MIISAPTAISPLLLHHHIPPLKTAKISLQLDAANKYKNNMLIAMNSVFKERGIGYSNNNNTVSIFIYLTNKYKNISLVLQILVVNYGLSWDVPILIFDSHPIL